MKSKHFCVNINEIRFTATLIHWQCVYKRKTWFPLPVLAIVVPVLERPFETQIGGCEQPGQLKLRIVCIPFESTPHAHYEYSIIFMALRIGKKC